MCANWQRKKERIWRRKAKSAWRGHWLTHVPEKDNIFPCYPFSHQTNDCLNARTKPMFERKNKLFNFSLDALPWRTVCRPKSTAGERQMKPRMPSASWFIYGSRIFRCTQGCDGWRESFRWHPPLYGLTSNFVHFVSMPLYIRYLWAHALRPYTKNIYIRMLTSNAFLDNFVHQSEWSRYVT